MKKLANGIYKLTLGVPEELTPVRALKPASKWEKLNHLSDCNLPFQEADIFFKKTKRGFLIELPLETGEDVYGLGLQLKSFRQTAHKKHLRVNSDPSADTGDSHAPVPFYVTSKGYGVLIDTARYAAVYAGNVKKVNGDRDKAGFCSADNPGMWWQIRDGSGNMVIDIPTAEGADLYFFAGDSMKDAVSRYNLFSGGGPQIPIWGLGILYRGYMHADSRQIRALAQGLRDDRLPCDIFGLEPGWQTHSYSCTYQWDPVRFPDHEELAAFLKKSGFKLNLWEHAYVHPSSPAFSKLKSYSGDSYVWDGRIPDFLTEGGTSAFLETQEPLLDEGVSGFKLDECDNSDFLSNWGFPDYTAFPSGADGEQMHSLFGLLYQRTLLSAFKKRDLRTIGQVRSSGACASPYPFVLYSDLYEHADFIRGMGSAAFSGLLWSPEVRQAGSEEELLRRIAAVIASPQALLNCFMIPSPPWKQFDLEKNLAGQLLEGSELTDKVRTLFALRMQLVPHLYTAFCEYRENGTPPIRPLIMDFPNDKAAVDLWDEYMMGEGLLAAPVVFENEGQTGRSIYLPAGTWYDFYTGEPLEGGKSYYREVPPEQLPLFVRKGTMLALADPLPFLSEEQVFDITLQQYGGGSCRLYLSHSSFSAKEEYVVADHNGIPANSQYRCKEIRKIH